MGHAVGGCHLGDGHIADNHGVAIVGGGDDGTVLIDAQAHGRCLLAVKVGLGDGIRKIRDCCQTVWASCTLRHPISTPVQLSILVIILGISQRKILALCALNAPLLLRARAQNIINRVASLPQLLAVGINASIFLCRLHSLQGNPQRNQLGAQNQLILNIFSIRFCCCNLFLCRARHIVRIVHHGEAVSHVALTVHDIAHGVNVEVAGAGQHGAVKHIAAAQIHILGAHHEKSVAVNHAVQTPASGVEGSGRHVKVNGAHLRTVTDLGGGVAAPDGGAVAACPAGSIQGFLENHPLGLIGGGVHVGDIVADDVEVGHVGLEAADSGIHCSSHAIKFSFFAF